MLSVETRQNEKGNWWCNTTHAGYDLFEEGTTIEEARQLITETLNRRGLPSEEIKWEEPKLYPKKEPVSKSEIGYATWRIDKGMV